MIENPTHIPVLLDEVLDALQPRADGIYVDGTFGGGGHTRAILDATAPAGRVIACDLDPEAVERGTQIKAELADPGRLIVLRRSFANLRTLAAETGIAHVDGIVLDLGLSSYQLSDAGKGFSFRSEGSLDMRFDPAGTTTAGDLVETLSESELSKLLWEFGEERQARRIASAIVKARTTEPIQTTTQLADLVEKTVGGRRGAKIHPATRTFQALRIAVNRELEALADALDAAVEMLVPGGRIAVIAFHSLEDRIVKRWIRTASSTCICPPNQPICTCSHRQTFVAVGKPLKASADEIDENIRSRSAILRVAERVWG